MAQDMVIYIYLCVCVCVYLPLYLLRLLYLYTKFNLPSKTDIKSNKFQF